MIPELMNHACAGAIGGALGTVELLGRYRDDPWEAIRCRWALFYIVVNIAAAGIAYRLIIVLDVTFGLPAGSAQAQTMQLLCAGLGAMALFRTSLLNMRVAETDIAVGPGMILQLLLAVTDRALDRDRALPRAAGVPLIMDGVDFDRAAQALPAFCFGVMQNVLRDEQEAFGDQLRGLADADLSNRLKANLLGLLLLNLVGRRVLVAAVKALGDEIRVAQPC